VSLIEISVEADSEAAEAVCELFNRLAPGGAVVEQVLRDDNSEDPAGDQSLAEPPVTVKAYLPASDQQSALRQALEEGLWYLGRIYPFPEPHFRELADTDWAEAWKQHYAIQRVGRRLVVVPSWLDPTPAPDDLVIRLDPGLAFGTGLHPSTRLCCATLEDLIHPGDRVLDVGTGSGILAIAAARLSAGRVLGLDIDPVAVRVARENVGLNNVAAIVQIELGTIPPPSPLPWAGGATPGTAPRATFSKPGTWDVVVANILAPVIINLAAGLAAALALGGRLVVSGIIADQADAVTTALATARLAVISQRREGDWVALIATAGG
jgi:ribosomal protein L11 methyltransferase